MSAFVCSEKHINTIVGYGSLHKVTFYTEPPGAPGGVRNEIYGNETKVASLLLNENIRSVNGRYAQADEFQTLQFKQVSLNTTPVQVLKLINCLQYQSCENDDYKDSDAYKCIKAIEGAAIRKLPGYDAAEWCID